MSDRNRQKSALLFAGVGVAIAALLFLVLGGRGSGSDFTTFLGRFHPLAVHLPIGAVVLLVVLELASFSPKLRDMVDPVLPLFLRLTLIFAVAALALGLLAAKGGGYPERLVGIHQRLMLATAFGVGICVVTWARAVDPGSRRLHRLVTFGTFGVMTIGAHFGGSLTHGEGYLFEFAPSFIKGLGPAPHQPAPSASASAAPASGEARVFDDVILPVLKDRCAKCHGGQRPKAGLRVESFDSLVKGGDSGAAIEPGNTADSLLVKALTAPLVDEAHMPPEGKTQLTSDEIELIVFWVDRGASPTMKVRDLVAPDGARRLLQRATTPTPPR